MNLRPVLLMIALPLASAACGNKGPLVLPPAPVEAPETPETPDGTVPVEVEPQRQLPEAAPPADALADPTAAEPLIDPLAEPAPEPALPPGASLPIDPATLPEPGEPAPADDDGDDDGNG